MNISIKIDISTSSLLIIDIDTNRNAQSCFLPKISLEGSRTGTLAIPLGGVRKLACAQFLVELGTKTKYWYCAIIGYYWACIATADLSRSICFRIHGAQCALHIKALPLQPLAPCCTSFRGFLIAPTNFQAQMSFCEINLCCSGPTGFIWILLILWIAPDRAVWASYVLCSFPLIFLIANRIDLPSILKSIKPVVLRTNWVVSIPWTAASLWIERRELATCCAHFRQYFSLPIISTDLVF